MRMIAGKKMKPTDTRARTRLRVIFESTWRFPYRKSTSTHSKIDSRIRQYIATKITSLVQVPSFRGVGENPVAIVRFMKRASCSAASPAEFGCEKEA